MSDVSIISLFTLRPERWVRNSSLSYCELEREKTPRVAHARTQPKSGYWGLSTMAWLANPATTLSRCELVLQHRHESHKYHSRP